MRPRFDGVLAATAIAAVAFACAESLWFGVSQRFQNSVLDRLVRVQAARSRGDPAIVIIDIDESSLARLQDVAGRWPWPRAIHAELIEGIAAQRPQAIVFDLLFSDIDTLRPDSDALLSESLRRHANIFVPMIRLPPAGDARGAPLRLIAQPLGLIPTPRANVEARLSLLAPIALDQDVWRAGAINFMEDADGVGRRYSLHLDAHGYLIPSLPARVANDLGWKTPETPSMLLRWAGDPLAYRHVSYADVFEDLARGTPARPRDEFAGKIVIIGSAATGLQDLRVSPISSLHPGVEILSTAIDNLRNDRAMREWPVSTGLAIAVALMGGLYAAFARRAQVLKIGAVLLLATLLLATGAYVLVGRGVRAPLIAPLVAAWFMYGAAALGAYWREKAARDRAVGLFGRFLNPSVVRELVDLGATPESLSGQSREISILFSDIRGFTTLSESRPPEEIVRLLNRYFSLQVQVVFRHGGTLDKFIGDAIMAIWGAPVTDDRHAQRAVAAALEMTRVLDEFRRELASEGLAYAQDFDVGIGIHTGPAVVGFIGSAQKLDYTAIGDTVNLASRIEGLTKGVARVLVSRQTKEACGEAFEFVARGAARAKGRAQDTDLFEPMSKAVA